MDYTADLMMRQNAVKIVCLGLFLCATFLKRASSNNALSAFQSPAFPWLQNPDVSIPWHKLGLPHQPVDNTSYTVGFYHIFAKGNAYESVVKSQVANIYRQKGLIDRLDTIFYTTIQSSNGTKPFTISIPKFNRLTSYLDQGEELYTLAYLYQFCRSFPSSKVFYFHNKGSFHNSSVNTVFRNVLDCYVLNEKCISTLKEFDTCGLRFSPIPHPHYR